jgi:transcriptional regulator with XRE-family HTH domain
VNIRTEREATGISQAELAKRTGIHQSKLSKMENGHIEPTLGEETLILTALTTSNIPLSNAENAQTVPEETDYSEDDYSPRLMPYPAAPTELKARQTWMAQRNRAFQAKAVPAPESGTFGSQKKAKS